MAVGVDDVAEEVLGFVVGEGAPEAAVGVVAF